MFRVLVIPLLGLCAAAVEVAARPSVHGLAIAGGLVALGLFAWVPKIAAPVNAMIAHLYRRQALAADFGPGDVKQGGRLAWLLTPDAFRAPHFRYDDQTATVDQLVEFCRNRPDSRYWFVEGDSGSGKTRAALLLAQTLTRDEELCAMGQRCYLYDFSSIDSQRTAAERLGGDSHRGQVVLVDNFHMVTSRTLAALTRRFLDRPGVAPERLVVFMARPMPFWSLNPGSDVSLVERAKSEGRHRRLRGPATDSLTAQVLGASQLIASGIARLAESNSRATGVQMHLAQTATRRRADLETVGAVVNILGASEQGAPDAQLAATLGIASALAMHRGNFTFEEFVSAARSVAGAPDITGIDVRELKRILVRLRRSGLLPRERGRRRGLTFHEGFAELCIDRLSTRAEFLAAFHRAARDRLLRPRTDGDTERWLIAAELNDAALTVEGFDAAASVGAYARMAQCLDRLSAREELCDVIRVQRAILLDRIGRFGEARSIFASVDARPFLESEPYLGAILMTGRIEATHDALALDDAELLARHPDLVIAAVGEYWQLHMGGHQGTFSANRLLELATLLHGSVTNAPSHWTRYATLRMYTDSLRHLYLSGRANLTEITSRGRQNISRSLRQELAITEAFDTLYTRAHFLVHVIIPGLAIFAVAPTEMEAEHIGLGNECLDVDTVLEAAAREYRRAKAQFASYGDREAIYLQADEMNLQMVRTGAHLEASRTAIESYQTFITQAGFADLASYPHLYLFRWHALSYFQTLLSGGANATTGADLHLDAARHELRLVAELDALAGNDYGIYRAGVLRNVLRLLGRPLDREWASGAAHQALANGYGIEVKLIHYLLRTRPLSQAEVFTVLRFYPFVHQ